MYRVYVLASIMFLSWATLPSSPASALGSKETTVANIENYIKGLLSDVGLLDYAREAGQNIVAFDEMMNRGVRGLLGAQNYNLLDNILNNEGGFQEDKSDRGNYVGNKLIGTNYGITPKKLAEFKGVDPKNITRQDIQDLTKDKAKEIYEKDLKSFHVYEYPKELQEQVFDIFTNHGYKGGLRIIQRAANATVDGEWGKETKKAVQNLSPQKLVNERILAYKKIVKNDPSQKKFLKGWINRANKYGR